MSAWEMKVEFDIAESGIYPMTTREINDLLPVHEREAALDEVLDLRLGYTEARGTEALRGLIAGTYRDSTAEDILVTTGAIEANYLLFNTLLDAGDHIVTIYPAYQQLYAVAQAIGCDVSLWKLNAESGFQYDLDELERLVTPNTKLIVVNTPHNPTGAMLSATQLQRVYDLAASVGAWLLCDEAYRWLDLPGGEAMAPPIRDYGERGISVGTISKPFGLPGLRIGWIAAPAPVVQACWAARDYISLSPGKLNDKLAQIALANRDRIIARNHGIVEANMKTATAWFAEHADLVQWTPPRGGLLALLKYNVDVPSRDVSDRLAGEYSVMLAPGSAFGFEGHLRIGVGQTPEIFAEGLARTALCLEELRRSGRRRT
jgi:aspartate/methionine/tyrosine aminotransferase